MTGCVRGQGPATGPTSDESPASDVVAEAPEEYVVPEGDPKELVLETYGFTADGSVGSLSDSAWVSNDGYVVKSLDITSDEIPDKYNGVRREIGYTMVCENEVLRATYEGMIGFYDTGGEWRGSEPQDAMTLEPIAGIPDAALVEHVQSLIDMANKQDVPANVRSKQKLSSSYDEKLEAKVTKSTTAKGGKEAVVAITAGHGLATYEGELTAGIAWTGEDWELESCTANDGAYLVRYDGLIGEWQGWNQGSRDTRHGRPANGKPRGGRADVADDRSDKRRPSASFAKLQGRGPRGRVPGYASGCWRCGPERPH